MTAKEIVPQLVLKETPLLSFLRTDDYDPVKAARRLTRYWKFRQEFFDGTCTGKKKGLDASIHYFGG